MSVLIHRKNITGIVNAMQASFTLAPAEVVKRARACVNETQRAFAERLNSRQSLISKYERGLVSPPSDILIHCMNLGGVPVIPFVSELELQKLIGEKLAGDEKATARHVVAQLVQCL